ncbi:MAG: hypothetical protein LBT40_01555 [Deltaproteobacteria bacterium]|nr:hypothetical protein [Deltaproteobacteria bacterium]
MKPASPETWTDKITKYVFPLIITIIGGIIIWLVSSFLTHSKESIATLTNNMNAMRSDMNAMRSDLKADLDRMETRLLTSIGKVETALKDLSEKVENLRVDMAKCVPATSTQATCDSNDTRPQTSDNPSGSGNSVQGNQATSGAAEPSSR